MASCFVTRELPGPALGRLRSAHEVEVWPERTPVPREELVAAAARAEGLLTMLTEPVDAELIAAAPGLRAISNYAVGTDNVDVDAATARGIPVGNTPDVLTDSTADLAVALMLAIARRLPEAERVVREGDWATWEPSFLLGRDLHGAAVGIVGAGRIGRGRRRSRSRGSAARSRSPAESDRAALDHAARAVGLRHPALPAHRADARPDRRAGAAGDEADGVSGQHRPRPDRRSAGARAGAARGLDRGRRPRRHRPRAAAGRSPAARGRRTCSCSPTSARPPTAPARRWPTRGRQPARRPRGRADAVTASTRASTTDATGRSQPRPFSRSSASASARSSRRSRRPSRRARPAVFVNWIRR